MIGGDIDSTSTYIDKIRANYYTKYYGNTLEDPILDHTFNTNILSSITYHITRKTTIYDILTELNISTANIKGKLGVTNIYIKPETDMLDSAVLNYDEGEQSESDAVSTEPETALPRRQSVSTEPFKETALSRHQSVSTEPETALPRRQSVSTVKLGTITQIITYITTPTQSQPQYLSQFTYTIPIGDVCNHFYFDIISDTACLVTFDLVEIHFTDDTTLDTHFPIICNYPVDKTPFDSLNSRWKNIFNIVRLGLGYTGFAF